MAQRKAIGYVRVSTAEQVQGYGLPVQRQAIRAYCKDHDLRLVTTLADEGQSGSDGLDDRQGLADALVRIERGEAVALVVHRLDRLARDLLLQETIVARMRLVGADVVSVTVPDGGDEHTRDLLRQVLGAVSQYEKAVIRGRMMAGKAAKIAKGGYGGGRPRFGYKAKDKALVVEEAEQATVRIAHQLRREGLSLRQIASRLEADGRSPKSGKRWHPTQVARILEGNKPPRRKADGKAS
jgi:DNA invertase Pin-like site-specific DNA recombinase